MDQDFVTMGGAVDILGVSKTRVVQLVNAGIIPVPERLGTQRVWRRADLEAVAAKREEVRARRVATRASLRDVVAAR